MSSRLPIAPLATLALLLLVARPVDAQALASYRLTVAESGELRVRVEAVVSAGERLAMSDYGAWSQPRGWASFVHDLRVTDTSGPLEVTPLDGGWRVAATDEPQLGLSYEVDLSHAAWSEWPDGPRTTSAYSASGSTFGLLGTLLAFTSAEESCELVFQGPGWGRVVAPFESPRPGVFQVESVGRATKNVFAFGTLEVVELSVGALHVQAILFGENARSAALFTDVVRSALESFSALFETGLDGELLAIVYPDRWDTGEAYDDSFVLATTHPLVDDDVAIWGQSIAHELFHRWLGARIQSRSWADGNWFSEGVTDYVASLFLVRRGLVGADVFLDQLEKHAAFHRLYHKGPPFQGLDLVSAGSNKGVNNAAIYDGGWLTAFALDLELQERSGGAVGIEEFLQRLLLWSSGSGEGYDNEVLVELLDELSGSRFQPFFFHHVEGTRPLDLPALCSRAGIDLRIGAVQVHARLDPAADRAAVAVRDRLIMGAFDAETRALAPQIDAIFAEFLAPDSPGASLTILREDREIHSRGYGLADLERPQPIRPDTVFHAASVSKQLTAFAVLLLEAEGRLTTEDQVLDWLPELTCAQGVRIRHLLEHTSGLRDQWQLLGLRGVRTDGDVITQDDVLQLLFRQEELGFEPGTEQAYCNSGYTLLAEIVARAADTPFPRFMDQRIFAPLGMTGTRFQEGPGPLLAGRALSYVGVSEGGFENLPLAFGTFGATGLMTTTEDLVRWARNTWELSIGSAELYERLLERGRLIDGTEVNFTNGVQVRSYRGHEIFGHPGADAGYRSAIVVVPEQRLALALLGNVDTVDMWGLPDQVLELFLSGPTEAAEAAEDAEVAEDDAEGETSEAADEPSPPSSPAPAADFGELVGRYYSRELDTSYELELLDGSLVARHIRNGLHELEPAGHDRFLCDRWYLSELTIERDAPGAPIAFRASSSRSRGVRFVRQKPPPSDR